MSFNEQIRIANVPQPVNLIEIANRDKDKSVVKNESGASSFKEMFSRELAGDRQLHFSEHARRRLHSRGIELSDSALSGLANAVDKASSKGAKETLVLTDDAAFVIAIDKRTVITAFDRNNLREGVVTSIDSAVII